MKKALTIVVTLFILLLSSNGFSCVFAEETDTSTTDTTETSETEKMYLELVQDDVRVRTGPGTTYDILKINDENQYYLMNVDYEILDKQTNEKGELWYQVANIINDVEYDTWVRSDFILLHYYEEDEDFEKYLDVQGFPESYKEYLRYLHTQHPDWIFVAYQTGIEFSDILAQQCVLGKSLIDGSNVNLRSTQEGAYNASTGQFIALDGYSWYQANEATVAYYMDPRNFLTEEGIFQFSKLSFNESETPEIIQHILDGTFMSGNVKCEDGTTKSYAEIFYEAGKEANVSPIYLATLAIQEQGTTGSAATDGRTFTYNGTTYSGLYNFFNIHAYSGADNWKYGLVYASNSGSYGRPWDSIEKSIKGGALWIADGYIDCGQDTLYYEKFNCVTKEYWHQYQTNVRAAYLESSTIYDAYKSGNALDSCITFSIPVYKNMPEKTALPTSITYPTDETVPNEDYYSGDLILDLDLQNTDGYLNGFFYQETLTDLKKKLDLMNSKMTVKVLSNGSEISDDTNFATGQVLQIIDEDGEVSSYTIIIKGDIDGDGTIGTKDYLIFRKTLLDIYKMNETEKRAALLNGETSVSTKGYLYLRKYLLGIGEIEQ